MLTEYRCNNKTIIPGFEKPRTEMGRLRFELDETFLVVASLLCGL